MLNVLLVGSGLAVLAASALLWAMTLRLESLATLLLTAYLVAWSELVLGSLVLSAARRFETLPLLASLVAWLAVATAVWISRGCPRPVAARRRLRWLGAALRIPELAVPTVVLGAGYAYLLSLGLFTPQNDSDPLVYQLTRAAMWRQERQIGLLGTVEEPRLDVNPIVAEVGQAATMILAGSERFVWLVQLSAVAAISVGAYVLARRVGVIPQHALLAALLVPMLPVVATQAITGYNDLVVASFVVAAAAFVLGRRRADLIPLATAVALAVGTKFTVPFLLPVVALLGVLAQPRRNWMRLAMVGGAGVVVGGGWYAVNLYRTGEFDGGLASFAGQEPVRTLPTVVMNIERLTLDAIELPGATGLGWAIFVAAGSGLVALDALFGRVRHRTPGSVALAGAGLALTPALVAGLSETLATLFAVGWDLADRQAFADETSRWRPSTIADGATSWYGPLAPVLAFGVIIRSVGPLRSRTLDRASIGLAVAPLLGILIFALAISYDPWRGRFLAALWVMNAALWGALIDRRAYRLTVVAVTTVVFVLSLVAYVGKPLGVDALSASPLTSVWALERWQQHVALRGIGPRQDGERLVLAETERLVPASAPMAVSVARDDTRFPYFGRELQRRVSFVGRRGAVPSTAAWLSASPETAPLACPGTWRAIVEHPSGWRLYQRTRRDACSEPAPLRPRGT